MEMWNQGFSEGKSFALANRFYDPKISGFNIKGCETWPSKFRHRGDHWSCGFAEGILAGLH